MLDQEDCVARMAAWRAGCPAHFAVAGSQTLEVRLDGRVWVKQGAFFAYEGEFEFDSACPHHGRETEPLTSLGRPRLAMARGTGVLYLADFDREVVVLDLASDELCVSADRLLAFPPTVWWQACPSHSTAGLVTLAGSGPVALAVPPDATQSRARPSKTTVADSPMSHPGDTRTLAGRGGGGPVSLRLDADGTVAILPRYDVRAGLSVG